MVFNSTKGKCLYPTAIGLSRYYASVWMYVDSGSVMQSPGALCKPQLHASPPCVKGVTWTSTRPQSRESLSPNIMAHLSKNLRTRLYWNTPMNPWEQGAHSGVSWSHLGWANRSGWKEQRASLDVQLLPMGTKVSPSCRWLGITNSPTPMSWQVM